MKAKITLSENDLRNIISKCIEEAKLSIAQQEAFDIWKATFDKYLSMMINELQTDYLNELGLTISINQNYTFNGGKSRWLAVYERSSGKIKNGVISIGINYPSLYRNMRKRNIDKDRFNIEAQARITIGHEIGHGLFDYISNLNLNNNTIQNCPNASLIIKNKGSKKEEDIVEEFGESLFPEATGIYGSIICNALEEIDNTVCY